MSDDEHGGYPLRSPFRRRLDDVDPLGAADETPVDLAAVQADDALLDWLHRGRFDPLLEEAGAARFSASMRRTELELTLARVLVAWRHDVDSEPIGRKPARRVPGWVWLLLVVTR